MRALREYKPKSSSHYSENEAKLIYHPLTKRISANRNRNNHQKSKSLNIQFKERTQHIPNGFDNGSCFFFKINDENVNEALLDNDQGEFLNFNCTACNKWFFCKRLTDHELECPIINKFKGSGDKTDFKIDTHLNISNNNILRQSIVCYLCGNRYSFRSIIYHEERCGKKFLRFCKKLPKKPEISDTELLEMVNSQLQIGNHKFAIIDAFNDIMFKESLKNEELLKSRLKYY